MRHNSNILTYQSHLSYSCTQCTIRYSFLNNFQKMKQRFIILLTCTNFQECKYCKLFNDNSSHLKFYSKPISARFFKAVLKCPLIEAKLSYAILQFIFQGKAMEFGCMITEVKIRPMIFFIFLSVFQPIGFLACHFFIPFI